MGPALTSAGIRAPLANLAFLALACSRPQQPKPAPTEAAPTYAQAVDNARRADAAQARRLLPKLVATLAQPDRDGWLHRAAVDALGRARDPRAGPALGRIVEAPPYSVEFFLRRLAARALTGAGGPEAAGLLVRNLTRREDGLVLEEDCRAALVALGGVARPALEQALAAGDPDLIAAAARTLAALGDRAALPALRVALASPRAAGPARRAIDEAIFALSASPEASKGR